MKRFVKVTVMSAALTVLLAGRLCSQESNMSDTVRIDEVLVTTKKADAETGYRKTEIDSKELIIDPGGSLAGLLKDYTSLVIKDYGQGGLATSAFRGMGPNHTSVLWEGIRINPVMTGQVDFSLIPSSMYTKVTVYHGGFPGDIPDGGPGGTIALSSSPDWKDGTDTYLDLMGGSFGLFSGSAGVVTGNSGFQYSGKFSGGYSKNNFTYFDDNVSSPGKLLTRNNADLNSRNTLQTIDIRSGNSIISGKLWYSYSYRDLPGPTNFPSGGDEKQYDESIRTMVSVKNYSLPVSLEFRGAWMTDWLRYIYTTWGTDSKNKSDRLALSMLAKRNFNEKYTLKFSVSDTYDMVRSVNYDDLKRRNSVDMAMVAEGQLADRFSLLLMMKEQVVEREFNNPEPSVGFDFRLTNSRNWFLKGNLGKSLVIPGMNDLYWNPGGDPGLRNEKGLNGELSLVLDERGNRSSGVLAEGTFSLSRTSDMIKWVPGPEFTWIPTNIASVQSKGFEMKINGYYSFSKNRIEVTGLYAYTDARGAGNEGAEPGSEGKQLIYVPLNSGSVRLSYEHDNFLLNLFTSYSGLRYVTSDNSSSLPGYVTTDISVAYKMKTGICEFDVIFGVDNLFNVSYQNIQYYPMPGRLFNAGLRSRILNR